MKILISLAIVVLLSACATSGNEKIKDHTQSSISQQITEGKTTKAEIINAFGQATATSFTDDGNEVWTYSYVQSTPHATSYIPLVRWISSSVNVTRKELEIIFNRNDVVSKYTMQVTDRVTNTGILPINR